MMPGVGNDARQRCSNANPGAFQNLHEPSAIIPKKPGNAVDRIAMARLFKNAGEIGFTAGNATQTYVEELSHVGSCVTR